jgi:hypothetical protein
MPQLDTVANTGPEWLLPLLERCSDQERLPLLMTVWRIWHAHNETTHGKPAPPTEVSSFYISILHLLLKLLFYIFNVHHLLELSYF